MKNEKYMWLCFFAAILILGLYFTVHYVDLIINDQERFKLSATFGMMLVALGGTFMVFFLSQIERDRQFKSR